MKPDETKQNKKGQDDLKFAGVLSDETVRHLIASHLSKAYGKEIKDVRVTAKTKGAGYAFEADLK